MIWTPVISVEMGELKSAKVKQSKEWRNKANKRKNQSNYKKNGKLWYEYIIQMKQESWYQQVEENEGAPCSYG